ncbi:TRAP transporter substrate-binding protein DctP [uncultured Hyphomonas sp.]|uniref:TRAP transporter substrate-binding protein n=1 Tax=uncultured Hyphomonas sp. TaxID=225298 RepID=UPI002AAAD173|nr:TRAP transporter substrate-binding protein DctP [uncultured Hyphomonas sp.]
MSVVLNRRFLLQAAAAFALAGCQPASQPRLRLALAGSPNASWNGVWVWMQAFMTAMETAGQMMALSTNASLGREEDRTELTGNGLLQLNDASISEATAFSEAYVIAQLPFLFRDLDQFDRLLEDESFMAEVNERLARAGLVLVDAAFLGGMSGLFTTQRPVRSLKDMRGLRLRAMDRRDLVLIEAFGASGVQVAWEETPQALQTGIASGYFNPPLAPVLFGHGAYLKYFSDLRVAPAHRLIVASSNWMNALDSGTRQSVEAAFAAGRAANREWSQKRLQSDMRLLEDSGIEPVAISDDARAGFREKAVEAYGAYARQPVIDHAIELAGRYAT